MKPYLLPYVNCTRILSLSLSPFILSLSLSLSLSLPSQGRELSQEAK